MQGPENRNGTPPEAGEPKGETPKWEVYVEDAVIALGILPLWPVILGWTGWVWQGLLYGDLAVLLFIFSRRLKRAKKALESAGETDGPAPGGKVGLPFVPPGRKL